MKPARASAISTLLLAVSVFALARHGWAQEGYFRQVFRTEREQIRSSCAATELNGKPRKFTKRAEGCLIALVNGYRGLYPVFDTFPPQNSVALGLAFKDSEITTEHWRGTFDVGGGASPNASWTAGGFLTLHRSPAISNNGPVIVTTSTPPTGSNDIAITNTLRVSFSGFNTSLQKLVYYGIGPSTARSGQTFYGFSEGILGTSAALPLKYGFYLVGEVNGRWPSLRSRFGEAAPSIEQLYGPTTAPGIDNQPAFLQLGEGIRFKRDFGAQLDLNYLASLQEFVAPSDSRFSFRRLTLDFVHEIRPLLRDKPIAGASTTEHTLRVTLRALLVESIAPAGHVVPFYFQPSLGGSDLNKERTLASYADYRFRAPDAMLFRAEVEQPLPKFSILGLVFRADSGKVANQRGDLDLTHMRHSLGAGISLRAGNFPYVKFMYSWGGKEGSRGFVDVNLSALASSEGRASLW